MVIPSFVYIGMGGRILLHGLSFVFISDRLSLFFHFIALVGSYTWSVYIS